MPKLAGVVDSLETVDEGVRGLYVEQNGKFVLDADVESHPAVAGLKSTVKAVRGEKDQLAATLKGFRDLGLTPEQILELKTKAETAAAPTDGKSFDLEKILSKRLAEQESKFKPVLDELSNTKAELRKIRLNDTAKAAALKAGMLPEDVEDEIEILVKRGRLQLDDAGKVVVHDEDGPIGKSLEAFFAEDYKQRKPKVFAGTGASGSSTRGGGSGGGETGGIRVTKDQASDAQFMAAALKKVNGDWSKIKIADA